ncbi:hypothetical protein BJV78DRAFT_1279434 [Lactifluus subvellereus]|nr:hypothetical protein BJV78DRAFT_1279434 [Lactifluus subvellereus]
MASLEDPHRHIISGALAQLAERRFRDFGVRGVQETHTDNPAFIGDLSLSSLTASLTESSLSSMTDEQWIQHIQALRSIQEFTNVAEMEEAIKYCRLLVASFHHDPRHPLAYIPVSVLDVLLFRAFKRTDKIEYLNESIALKRDILKMPDARPIHSAAAAHLLFLLLSRFGLLWRREDLDEIMQLFPMTVNDTNTTTPQRFNLSCDWAMIARYSNHPSITAAYANSISLMQDTLYYAPTLEIQHFHLVTMRDIYETLPLDYASYQVQIVDSALASKFIAINSELEELTMSMAPSGNMETDSNGVEGPEGMDPFGRLVVKQRKLFEERNSLVSQIQSLPDFKSFLMSPSFDTLRSAASRGPVIIINHSEWRSDILILLHDTPPSLITTNDDFYDRAIELSNRLVETRKEHRLESKQYRNALRSVLSSLYELNSPEFGGVRHLCFVLSPSTRWDQFLQINQMTVSSISSYTPTLSALIESRKPGGQTSGRPSIPLVAQPESLQDAIPEIWLIQCLSTKVTSLISKGATPSSVVEGLRDHQFSHFVCYGTLEQGKPFDASFQLYGGKRLTLLEIVCSRLPTAEFAFLSACHTAKMTDGSIADEGLHPTAAMQYCGFRSVVGTRWVMADADGQDVVEDFYKSILSIEEPGVPYHERSALALRDAVRKLRRKKGVPLERWVNFVHYGA